MYTDRSVGVGDITKTMTHLINEVGRVSPKVVSVVTINAKLKSMEVFDRCLLHRLIYGARAGQ